LSEEKTEITNRTTGYSFHVKVEREIRTQTAAKYPDKTVAYATLSGNDDTFEAMVDHAKKAKETIDAILAEPAKEEPEEGSEVAIESEKGPGE